MDQADLNELEADFEKAASEIEVEFARMRLQLAAYEAQEADRAATLSRVNARLRAALTGTSTSLTPPAPPAPGT